MQRIKGGRAVATLGAALGFSLIAVAGRQAAVGQTQPDTTPPNTVITSGPGDSTRDRTPTFTFESTESQSGFQCSLDGDPWQSCSSPYTTQQLDKGSHTFDVRAIDRAGNIDPTPDDSEFLVKRKHRRH